MRSGRFGASRSFHRASSLIFRELLSFLCQCPPPTGNCSRPQLNGNPLPINVGTAQRLFVALMCVELPALISAVVLGELFRDAQAVGGGAQEWGDVSAAIAGGGVERRQSGRGRRGGGAGRRGG